ncbi:MAG: hypothetical protein AAGA80_16305 [Cyanobacteria bacterium P01_F01_bin.143]
MMKRLVLSTLSALAFSSLVAPAFASEIAAANHNNSNNINKITPFHLVSGAYQGRFTNQGIPSFNSFLHAIRHNKIEAEDLVNSAVSAGRLPKDTLNDSQYLSSVDTLLENLDKN